MSGGSYDYLYGKDSDFDHLEHLAREVMRMAKDINADHPSVVADELAKLSILMDEAGKKIVDKWELLRNAMKAWEWYQSNDYSKEDYMEEEEKVYLELEQQKHAFQREEV